ERRRCAVRVPPPRRRPPVRNGPRAPGPRRRGPRRAPGPQPRRPHGALSHVLGPLPLWRRLLSRGAPAGSRGLRFDSRLAGLLSARLRRPLRRQTRLFRTRDADRLDGRRERQHRLRLRTSMAEFSAPDPEPFKIVARNLTARADYLVRGNPMNSRTESGVNNSFPGLEFDQRPLDERFFPGLRFEFHRPDGAIVAAMPLTATQRARGLFDADSSPTRPLFLWFLYGHTSLPEPSAF